MTAPMDIKEAAEVLRVFNEWRRETDMSGGMPNPTAVGRAIDAAVAALEQTDTIIERARELIGLHVSEQEGMMVPTARQFQNAIDALAQAIGARDQHPHPRERALSEDAARGNFRAKP